MSETVFNSLFSDEYKNKDNDDSDDYDYPKLEIDESRDADYLETDLKNLSPQGAVETWATYPYQCARCKNVCTNLLDLRDHNTAIHGLSSGFQCVDCAVVLQSIYSFVEHVKKHRPELIQNCPVCDLKFEGSNHTTCKLDTFEDLQDKSIPPPRVPLLVTEEPNKQEPVTWKKYPWLCQYCTISFQDLPSLRSHLKDVHRKCSGFRCADCYKKVRSFEEFIKHVKRHRPVLRELCEFCDFKISGREQYISHVKEHTLDFKCDVCYEFFDSSTKLDTHKSLFLPPVNTKVRKSDSKKFTCDVCGKAFIYASYFQCHKAAHADRTRGLLCDCCGKFYSSTVTLRIHKESHRIDPYFCNICNQTVSSSRGLQSHLQVHLDVEKLLECNECSRRFSTKAQLRCHMFRHTNVTHFRCQYCNKTFKFRKVLKRHEKLHQEVEQFSCKFCDMKFLHRYTCRKHIRDFHRIKTPRNARNSQANVQ